MKLAAWLACLWLTLCAAGPARAEVGRIVVLQPSAEIDSWPAATRAVIAELALGGYDITVQAGAAPSVAELTRVLAELSAEDGVVGAVLVVRRGERGFAHVWLRGATSPAVLSEAVAHDSVAPSALALKVTDLFRARSLPVPSRPETTPRDVKPPPVPVSERPEPPSTATLWLGQGAAWSPEAGAVGAVVAGGAQLPWFDVWAVDLGVEASLSPLNVDDAAGEVDVHAAGAALHVLYDPWRRRGLSLAAGLGAGFLWLRSSAVGNAGYSGLDDSTQVWLISTRARAAVKSGRFGVQLLLEPGLTLPSIDVTADDRRQNRLGRPWLQALLGVSWDL